MAELKTAPVDASVWAVIVAAGRGSRMGTSTGGIPKQYLPFQGAPLYMAFAKTVAQCPRVGGVVFVLPAADVEAERASIGLRMRELGLPFAVAPGGARRQDSVLNGLAALPAGCRRVLVHDAARPFATPDLVNRILDALETGAPGVIPGLSVTDTIKAVSGDGMVSATVDRDALRAVQTPQGFDVSSLRQAHRRVAEAGQNVTDDAAVLEAAGMPVRVVEGEPGNIKITRPEDLATLHTAEHRTGYGYDVHAYAGPEAADARPLKLGGVLMEGGWFVRAHSDGDVLIHAVMDAVLGCVGGADIGALFPDTSPEYEGADSALLLKRVLTYAADLGFTPAHADITIIAQKPKIGPQRQDIRDNVARLLGLPGEAVAVKATTEEHLGFTGALQGLKVVALVEGEFARS